MSQAMVTGRMDSQKKLEGQRILKGLGSNPSQAINLLYDRIIETGGLEFMEESPLQDIEARLVEAASFVDSMTSPLSTRFDNMTDAEIRIDRLKNRGLF